MKIFLLKLVLISALSVVGQWFLPWWIMPLTAFIINLLFKNKGWAAFFSGFLPGFFVWFIPALITHQETKDILTSKVATILPLGGSAFLLILVTGLVAALVTGLAAATGNALRDIIIRPKQKSKTGYHPAYRR